MSDTTISLGNGVTAVAFNVQDVTTTVTAQDGETVAIGGLISHTDAKNENKVPWLGDLPYVGTAFRYRTQVKNKTELLVILTPHVVRNRIEADRVLAEEAARMDWMLGDVTRFQGLSGMDPVLHPQQYPLPGSPGGGVDGAMPSPLDGPFVAPPITGDGNAAAAARRGARRAAPAARARPGERRSRDRAGAAGVGRGSNAGDSGSDACRARRAHSGRAGGARRAPGGQLARGLQFMPHKW